MIRISNPACVMVFLIVPLLTGARAPQASAAAGALPAHPPIPIRFTLREPGLVTLVIDDSTGKRVRNLVSETPFPAGSNVVYWDGLDDTGRVQTSPNSNFRISSKLVPAGRYRVRGLAHLPINLRYQFTVYNPGQPPWATADPSSEWLANHTPPSGVLFIPEEDARLDPAGASPGGQVLVCSYVTEGGSGLAWLNLEGKKLRGQMWIGGVWTGATHLARDAGPRRVRGVYAYTGSAWKGGDYDGPRPELRLAELLQRDEIKTAPRDRRVGQGDDRPLLTPNAPYSGLLPAGQTKLSTPVQDNRYTFPDNAHLGLSGLAVYNALLAASLPKMNELLWVDARARHILGTTPLDDPRGLAYDSHGRLLALSGRRLLRYPPGIDPLHLPTPEIVISSGLEDPQGITLDPAGRIYISDGGRSSQVKVFSPDGRFIRAIGTTGLPKPGPYNPRQMHHPNGITIDSRGHLWVAETDEAPKRVSVWSLDGTLIHAFYGPMEYGGGGSLDPEDKSRFYYGGMEFALDWKTGANRPVDIYYQPQSDPLGLAASFKPRAPETAIYQHGRRYLTDCYCVSPTNAADSASLWLMDSKGVARPVAALGSGGDWPKLLADPFKRRNPAGQDVKRTTFAWTDLNGDGRPEAEEVVVAPGDVSGVTVMPDLSFVVAYLDGKAVEFSPVGYTPKGAPRYDLRRGKVLATGTRKPRTSGGGQALAAGSGWTILTVPPEPFVPQASLAGVRDGAPLWTYPSLWPGLHPSHDAPLPDHPGELIGTTRLLGGLVKPPGSDAGPLWAINGNKGNTYLFTVDGLFVSTLFKDCRTASWSAPRAVRNLLVNNLSEGEENFWPSMTQTADGSIYLVTGGAGGSIIRVDGLGSIRRLPDQEIAVGPGELRQAESYLTAQEQRRQQGEKPSVLTVELRPTPPRFDDGLTDWNKSDFVPIDDHASAAIAVAGDRLYAAYRTGDAGLLKNSGRSVPLLFKTGGALDLMIGAIPGGERLLVTRINGKTTAVLYRPTAPGTITEPFAFSSPQRTVRFDRVDDVSDQVQLAGNGGSYQFSVPLALLGIQPGEDQVLRGDIGVLRGNGFQTLQRVYWHNKATGLVSDIPAEAELTPQLWGEWRFVRR